jgi:hypothetical protein
MENKNNPFSGYGNQVKGDAFVGRNTEINKIRQRMLSKEFGNASIVGLPKIGKSSLMYQAIMLDKDNLWDEKKILPIWSSVKKYKTPNEFYIKLVLTVFSELKRKISDDPLIVILNESLSELKIENLSFVETEHNLLCFFSDIVSAGIRVIVCLDEFDYAKELFDEVHYQLLRTLSYEPDHQIGFITTSRRSIFDIERYSGQGSNFFGTFENIRLGVFNDIEADKLFDKAENTSISFINKIKYFTGNHPFLISMVLYKYMLTENKVKNIDDILGEAKVELLQYFDDVFRVLEKDGLSEKLIRIYSGIYEGVSQTEEEYLMKYGLYIQNKKKDLVPFSAFFNDYINIKWREAPFKLIWPEAERALKKLITECVDEIYGDDWEEFIQDDLPVINNPVEDRQLIQSLKSRRKQERKLFGNRASNNLIDQLYPRHYLIFIQLHWNEYYKEVLGNTLEYWADSLEFISKRIRNPESHSRYGLLTDQEHRKASIICSEIVDKIETWFK